MRTGFAWLLFLVVLQFGVSAQAPDIIITGIIPNQSAYCAGDSVTISFTTLNFSGSNNYLARMSKSGFSNDSTNAGVITFSGNQTGATIGYRFQSQDADVNLGYQVRISSGVTVSALFPGSPFFVNPKPVAIATPGLQSVCSGVFFTAISLSTSNSVSSTTYTWSRNNTTNVSGTVSGTGDITATYLTNNTAVNQTVTYTITPTGPSPSFCTGAPITATIIVKPAPTISVVTADTICSGGSINLPFAANIPSSILWYADDNSNTSGEDLGFHTLSPINDTITNLSAVDQIVSYNVIATSIAGSCQGAQAYLYITVNPHPDATFTVSDTTPCSGDTINFAIIDTGNISSLVWIWGDGSPNSTCAGCLTKNHRYSSSTFPSIRTMKLIAISGIGCRDTSVEQINVKPIPRANFTVNDNTQCMHSGSNQFILTDKSTMADSLNNLLTYLWDFGDATIFENTEEASHTYALADSYFVYHSATSLFGCRDSISKLMVVFRDPQTAIKSSNISDTLCGGTTITLTADSGYTYLWSTNKTTRSIIVRDSVLANQYFVNYAVTVTDNHLCSASASKEITINPSPSATEIMYDTSLTFCAGAKAQLFQIANPVNATYLWISEPSIVSGYSGSQLNIDLPADTFTISVLATDNITGCSNIDTVTLYLSSSAAPIGTVVRDLLTLICTNNTVSDYQWGYDDSNLLEHNLTGETLQSYYVGSDPDVVISGKYYWVKITDSGGCQSKIYYQAPPSYFTNVTSEGSDDVMLRIYPNPVKEWFKVEINNYKSIVNGIEVYNASGQLIFKGICRNEMILDASEWTSGMYLLKVTAKEGVYKSLRLIKL